MDIDGQAVLRAPVDAVWQALHDPEVLRKCTPGCRLLTPLGNGQFEAEMEFGVAAVKGTFKGKLTIEDKVVPTHYHVLVDAKGTLGFARVDGDLRLEAQDGSTLVTYQSKAQIGGTIAGVGQRILGGYARKQVQGFFSTLEKEIGARRA